MTDTDIRIEPRLLKRIERGKARLDDRRPMPAALVRRLRDEMRLSHTYNSNAIEGNTLTLGETRQVLEDGITIGGKSLREHLEATGNAKAFDRVCELAKGRASIDHVAVQEIHELVTGGLQEDSGKYRTVNVRIAGAAKTPPDFSKVPSLMGVLFEEVSRRRAHPVLLSARLHHGIAMIHPFSDGNGRTARLAANLLLMRSGHPPVVLRKEDRRKYYGCLRRADGGDLAPFATFLARALDESLTLYLASFGGADALVPLSELAEGSPYSQEYLSLRARQGALSAAKIGKSWHSTQRAVDDYAQGHGRPQP